MYKKDGYFLRAAAIQLIDRLLYQPYHDSCHRMVWKNFGYPIYFYTYQTYLNYLKVKVPPEFNKTPPAIGGILETMHNGNGLKSLAQSYLCSVQACVGKLFNLILSAKGFSPADEAEYQRGIEREHKAELRAQAAKRKGKTKILRKTRPHESRTMNSCLTTVIGRPLKVKAKTVQKSKLQAKATAETIKLWMDMTRFTRPSLPSTISITERTGFAGYFYDITASRLSLSPVTNLITDFRLLSSQPDTLRQTSLPLISTGTRCDKTVTTAVPSCAIQSIYDTT